MMCCICIIIEVVLGDSSSHVLLGYPPNRQMENIPETLSNQLNIYHNKLEHDAAHLNMPGGVDVNNHEDIFRALMEKVPVLFVCLLWMPPRDYTCTCVHGS